jgi:hypothetical protein
VKEVDMGGSCSTSREIRISWEILARKPEGKRLLGRCKSRWEDNIEMYLNETG